MKKLKIAIVTNNYKPYSGGVVSSIDSFTNELINLGHEVLILTLDFLGNQSPQLEENICRLYCPIRFMYKKNYMALPWMAQNNMLLVLEKFKPDIIHSQHPFLLGQHAIGVSRKLKIPIVFTYHTKYEQYAHYLPFPTKLTKPIIKNIALNYSKTVDGIIAPSFSIFNELQENKIDKNIQVIPSGILPLFLSKECKTRNNNPFQLLTVSRFAKEKNIEFLLDAFSKLDQNKFIFTLIGYGSHCEALQKYAYNKLKLSEKNIIFLIKPSKEVITEYYNKSDLFLFASFTETQGLVLAEAMANGCPVIALNASGSSDIVKNDINGFLIDTKNEMTQKIIEISENKNLHFKMQEQAWQTGQKYSIENTTKKLINFYSQFL